MNFSSLLKNGLILLALLLAGTFFYIKVYLPTITFTSVSISVQDINETVFGVGSIEAKEVVILAPKTTAKIKSLFADQGDTVTKNQILAIMDPSELIATEKEAKMALQKSKITQLAQQSLIKDLKVKYDLAHKTLTRYQRLSSEGFIAQAELDSALTSEQSLKAQLENVTLQTQVMQADVLRNEAIIQSTEAKMEDLKLRAPQDMLVISRNAESGSTVLSGSPVFRLVNQNTIWVKIYINERQSGTLHVGQSASVTLRSQPSKSFQGRIQRIHVESDRLTEEREIDIALDTPLLPLSLGERAEATIHIASHTQVMTLPALCIVSLNGQQGVWLGKDSKAHFKPLSSLHVKNYNGLIIVEGFQESDKILLPSGKEMTEGMRVKL